MFRYEPPTLDVVGGEIRLLRRSSSVGPHAAQL